jgi:Flp pilus assembly protein TadG
MTRVATRLTRRGRNESGAILAITAILMIVFLGMAALAIDVGSFYQAQRQAQAAADAGALAGVQDLPSVATADTNAKAITDATSYVAKNFPGADIPTVTPNYNGVAIDIKVVVTATTPSFFGQIFGITHANVSATAIAGGSGNTSPAAVFASDTSCNTGGGNTNGILVSGNNETVPGGIASNGSLTVRNNNEILGVTTFGGPNGCAFTNTGNGPVSFPSGAPTVKAAVSPFPLDFSSALASLCPTFVSGNIDFKANSSTIPPGIYCYTGTISVSGQTVTGNGVTLIANSIQIGGNNVTITPAAGTNGLSLYQTGTGTLNIGGNSFSGNTIFAPNAQVVIGGQNTTSSGFIEAKDIDLHGNNFTFNGTGPPASGIVGSLIG